MNQGARQLSAARCFPKALVGTVVRSSSSDHQAANPRLPCKLTPLAKQQNFKNGGPGGGVNSHYSDTYYFACSHCNKTLEATLPIFWMLEATRPHFWFDYHVEARKRAREPMEAAILEHGEPTLYSKRNADENMRYYSGYQNHGKIVSKCPFNSE